MPPDALCSDGSTVTEQLLEGVLLGGALGGMVPLALDRDATGLEQTGQGRLQRVHGELLEVLLVDVLLHIAQRCTSGTGLFDGFEHPGVDGHEPSVRLSTWRGGGW